MQRHFRNKKEIEGEIIAITVTEILKVKQGKEATVRNK